MTNSKILHTESNTHKRKILEACYTVQSQQSINRALDVNQQFLPHVINNR